MDHINRYVSSVDVFIAFYETVLSYQLIDKGYKANNQKYAILKGDNHELFISEKDEFEPRTYVNFRHLGYAVDDIEIIVKRLKDMQLMDQEDTYIVKPYSKQVYIKDPDGFEIDLIQWTDKEGFYRSLRQKR